MDQMSAVNDAGVLHWRGVLSTAVVFKVHDFVSFCHLYHKFMYRNSATFLTVWHSSENVLWPYIRIYQSHHLARLWRSIMLTYCSKILPANIACSHPSADKHIFEWFLYISLSYSHFPALLKTSSVIVLCAGKPNRDKSTDYEMWLKKLPGFFTKLSKRCARILFIWNKSFG